MTTVGTEHRPRRHHYKFQNRETPGDLWTGHYRRTVRKCLCRCTGWVWTPHLPGGAGHMPGRLRDLHRHGDVRTSRAGPWPVTAKDLPAPSCCRPSSLGPGRGGGGCWTDSKHVGYAESGEGGRDGRVPGGMESIQTLVFGTVVPHLPSMASAPLSLAGSVEPRRNPRSFSLGLRLY